MRQEPLLASIGLLLLVACGGAPEAPPEILYGADACDYCRMIISEERHAAAAGIAGGYVRFDDPGCLLAWAERRDPAEAGIWVHDESGAWLRAAEAWFAVDPGRATPMASGVLAFSSAERAAAVGGDRARPVQWAEIGRILAGESGDQSNSLVEK